MRAERTSPPTSWRRFLGWVVPPTDRGDVLENLDILFHERLRTRGVRRATRWYRIQVAEFALRVACQSARNALPQWRLVGSRPDDMKIKEGEKVRAIVQDLRYGLRQLLRTPLVTITAVLSLSLAIGANTAIFGAVNALLLRDLPYQQPDRLVRIHANYPERDWYGFSVSLPNIIDVGTTGGIFSNFAAYRAGTYTLGTEASPVRITTMTATTELFNVLGVSPLLGRTFVPEDGGPSPANRVIVLSYTAWRDRFGSDSGILGRAVLLDGMVRTVVGVMPNNFSFTTDDIVAWVPLEDDATTWSRGRGGLYAIARLAPGTSIERARGQLATTAARLAEEYPRSNRGQNFDLASLPEHLYGSDIKLAVFALFASAGLLLLIACVNVAVLMSARATARWKEIAVRTALGAGRARVIRMLLAESLVLASLGGALGIGVAVLGMGFLKSAAPDNVVRLDQVGLDPVVALYTLLVTFATGLLFGILPARQAGKTEIATVLRENDRHSAGKSTRVAGRALISVQVGLAFVVLSGAGLMVRSMGVLLNVDPGFETQNRLAFTVALTPDYGRAEAIQEFQVRVLERIRSLPGVTGAGAVYDLPMFGSDDYSEVLVAGMAPEDRPSSGVNLATDAYFETMGIRTVRGRSFGPEDVASSFPVAVINEELAARFYPAENPLGKLVGLPGEATEEGPLWRTIVGVVEDVRHTSLRDEVRPELYVPFAQRTNAWGGRMTFVIRVIENPLAYAARVRSAVWEVDPDQAVFGMATLERMAIDRLGTTESLTWLLGLFGLVSLVLASVGLFGVVSYSVTRRFGEMGIRTALGATRAGIFGLILAQEGRPLVFGIIGGAIASLWASRYLEGLLFGISPQDPVTLLGVGLALIAVGLVAVTLPARRAASLNPANTLRGE